MSETEGKKPEYKRLSEELTQRIMKNRENGWVNPFKARDEDAIRRRPEWDKNTLLRPSYVRDCEKILHSTYYNRYADKTQVFSFYKNDDISRRALHVQLVSRIARNIGRLLGLNTDLIEAMALGHDIGHTPFGHAGERFLNEKFNENTGLFFNHNVHSVRVMEEILNRNLSLQALDGFLCHNGEFALKEYHPEKMGTFEDFDKKYEECYRKQEAIKKLVPYTLEACVVRISDMIAYLGKDRQDAIRAGLIDSDMIFEDRIFGVSNAQIINDLVVNIVENSYGKDYILMDESYHHAIEQAKKENYSKIYFNDEIKKVFDDSVKPMFSLLYDKLLSDYKSGDKNSVIYRHHVEYVKRNTKAYGCEKYFDETSADQMVVDFIASMTDDYFVDLFDYLFPKSKYKIEYISYFSKDGDL